MSKTTLPEYRTVCPANCGRGEDVLLADCQALIVCLSNGRFVIVRPDEQKDFWPMNGGWEKVRDLAAGDKVIYKGDKSEVRAVDVYH